MRLYLPLFLILAGSSFAQDSVQYALGHVEIGSLKISIPNECKSIPSEWTRYRDLGPEVGQWFNAHFFPGVRAYGAGCYREAYDQFTYCLERSSYLDGNANQVFYLTTAYYLRGMIFLYHASGPGRLTLAKQDFEAAIQLNDQNYPAHLELAHVFSSAGLKDQAIQALQRLIELKPDKETLERAEGELKSLTGGSK
jgi:tetratricopeptide (TPR) repeat protein